MEKIILFNNHPQTLTETYDHSIFENITWSYNAFSSHHDIAQSLKDKHPSTITVLIEILNWKFRNKKEYVIKTKTPIISKYRELLYEYFFDEYGQTEGNEIYRQWLEKYREIWDKNIYKEIDDFIIVTELEPRYRTDILTRFSNHDKLFKDRIRIDRERRYNLPQPFTRIDYRNSFDNIFVWEHNGQKVARKGGSGSSGQRETNSKFIYGLLELNKIQPVPSFLFLYSDENILYFIKKFESLCIPSFDVGYNYHLDKKMIHQLIQNGQFLRWNESYKVTSIETSKKLN